MIQSGIAIRLSNLSGHVWTLRQFPPRRRARASLRRSEPAAESRAHVDMAPTRRAPVVRLLKDGERHLNALKRGLIPYFTNNLKKARKPINARL